jgi:hypothetical protein
MQGTARSSTLRTSPTPSKLSKGSKTSSNTPIYELLMAKTAVRILLVRDLKVVPEEAPSALRVGTEPRPLMGEQTA